MERDTQIDAFENEIEKVIARFRQEYQIPYASLIGVLQLKQYELCKEAWDAGEEEDED